MKTKDYLKATLSGFSIAIVLAVVSFILVSCGNSSKDTRPTSGYIPIDVKPQISWVNGGGIWERVGYIKVVTAKGLITVRFRAEGSWMGSSAVVYRDTYPRCIGKKVYVDITYNDAGMPWISRAYFDE